MATVMESTTLEALGSGFYSFSSVVWAWRLGGWFQVKFFRQLAMFLETFDFAKT